MEASEPPPQNDVSHFLSKKIFGMITMRSLFFKIVSVFYGCISFFLYFCFVKNNKS